jgi:hypothetical protein
MAIACIYWIQGHEVPAHSQAITFLSFATLWNLGRYQVTYMQYSILQGPDKLLLLLFTALEGFKYFLGEAIFLTLCDHFSK